MQKRRGKAWSKGNVGALGKNRRDVQLYQIVIRVLSELSTLKLVMCSECATDGIMMVDHRRVSLSKQHTG